MKVKLHLFLFCFIFMACKSNKNIAQTSYKTPTDTLVQTINKSKKDTSFISPQIKKLAKENELLIAFATLNYAWTKKGTFYVLAHKSKGWTLYSYQSKLYPDSMDATLLITSIYIRDSSAENIKRLYASSQLWNTIGDENGRFCNDKKDCHITDAETWMISVATPKNIHTTTYYAPEFFEQCCTGNPYRKRFVAIAKEIIKLWENEIAQ